jgi:hypothetical protein
MDINQADKFPDTRQAPEQAGGILGSADEHFRVLLAALDLGWRVEEPVYIRPRWGESGNWVYHFILKKEALLQPCLITVRHAPEIERFILQEGWQVDQQPDKRPPFDYAPRAERSRYTYLH